VGCGHGGTRKSNTSRRRGHCIRLLGSLAPPVRNFTRRRHLGVYPARNGLIFLYSQPFCPGRHDEIDFRTLCCSSGLERRVNFRSVGARDPKSPFPWHFFQFKDQRMFGIAGLYDVWTDEETGKEIRSYTIITTEPNELVGQFHDRMPVILQDNTSKSVDTIRGHSSEPRRIQSWPTGGTPRCESFRWDDPRIRSHRSYRVKGSGQIDVKKYA
jgi:hypothetical protein